MRVVLSYLSGINRVGITYNENGTPNGGSDMTEIKLLII